MTTCGHLTGRTQPDEAFFSCGCSDDPQIHRTNTDTTSTCFHAQALSNTAWALVRLGCTPSPAWLDAFESASAPQLHACSPQHLATLLWALCKLGHQPGAAWWENYCRFSYRALPRFSYRDLANTAWAVANLGLRPPEDWLQVRASCSVHTHFEPPIQPRDSCSMPNS